MIFKIFWLLRALLYKPFLVDLVSLLILGSLFLFLGPVEYTLAIKSEYFLVPD